MPGSDSAKTFSSSDVKFILTFVAGMGAFWLSGHLPRYIPVKLLPHNYAAVAIITLVLALVIYGLGMFLWSFVILGHRRALKPVLMGTTVAVILALATSLTLTYTKIAQPHNKTELTLMVFALYVVYGIYFVAGWVTANKLARAKA
jgi:D-alanyl-lipoteichoic acid acyltransferase DltB (MBOAT superfamily)